MVLRGLVEVSAGLVQVPGALAEVLRGLAAVSRGLVDVSKHTRSQERLEKICDTMCGGGVPSSHPSLGVPVFFL